jgi:tyrosyl-tRNA synthetase
VTAAEIQREARRQLAVMQEGSVEFYGEEELRERLEQRLREGRPLRVKLGMDPSAPDLHLGHTVVLRKLRRFQELGHTPIFLVGDFTARIGDPSGRKKTRPALDEKEVERNAASYVEQAGRVLDVTPGHAEIRFNNEWMQRMSPAELVKLCSRYTVARLLERDDFAKRYKAGDPISVHEFLYPFVQAYDSVALQADVELGGTDQTFNLLMAREVQRDYGQPAQAVITHPLLVGLDGREKMSKSLGNAIAIGEAPESMYGQLMSISDRLMLDWFDTLASGEWGDLQPERAQLAAGGGDPYRFKHGLARRIVERFHGAQAAAQAAEHFRRTVQEGEAPLEMPEMALELDAGGRLGLLEILERIGLTPSRSEARRLIGQRAVSIDGVGVEDPALRLPAGTYQIKVGKRRHARVRLR